MPQASARSEASKRGDSTRALGWDALISRQRVTINNPNMVQPLKESPISCQEQQQDEKPRWALTVPASVYRNCSSPCSVWFFLLSRTFLTVSIRPNVWATLFKTAASVGNGHGAEHLVPQVGLSGAPKMLLSHQRLSVLSQGLADRARLSSRIPQTHSHDREKEMGHPSSTKLLQMEAELAIRARKELSTSKPSPRAADSVISTPAPPKAG